MKSEIAVLRDEGAKRREEIINSDAPGKEKSRLLREQKLTEENQVESVTDKYENLILNTEKEIADNEKRMKESRDKMDEGVSKANKLLSNSERLMQMRLDEQKKHYEDLMRRMLAVYDPEFTNKETKRILRSSYELSAPGTGLKSYSRDMKQDGKLSEEDFTQMKTMNENFRLLIGEARKIPYKNSMSRAVKQLENTHNSLMNRYAQFGESLLDTGRFRKKELSAYNYAFENLTKTSPETGYIVDSRNSESIVVYVNQVVLISNGFRAKVFRKDDEEIGEIEFLKGMKGGHSAKVISLLPGKQLQPFDRVLIEYKR